MTIAIVCQFMLRTAASTADLTHVDHASISFLNGFVHTAAVRRASLVGWNQNVKFTELSEGGTL